MPSPNGSYERPVPSRAQTTNRRRKVRRGPSFLRILGSTALATVIVISLFAGWLFLTPWGNKYRNLMVDTLITTQHRHWGKYLVGEKELNRRVEKYWASFEAYAEAPITETPVIPTAAEVKQDVKKKDLITVEQVEGKGRYGYYKGYILHISDPKKLRIVVPSKAGKGEKVSAMVQRTGALAGVNGGGFADPEWKGNGFQPTGIVMSGGKIFYLDVPKTTKIHVVGIDMDGKMVAGKYSADELVKMRMSEAVTFSPRFIVNGEGQIPSPEQGWGVAPRTSMAQTSDGTILFAVIDGRQTHSIGATLYEVQQLFLDRGAILAANLDGGSSTVLVKDNQIVNKPSSEYGERYLPTAWLVFNDPSIAIKNIWEGLDITKIDPSKW